MDTPILSHITSADYLTVYEPAEDSFLVLDALEAEIEEINNLRPTMCLEVGSGSGINIVAFANKFKSCFCTAIDINPKAADVTLKTSKVNNVSVECIIGDLMSNIRNHTMDVVIFNPPYVVTENSEIYASDISKAWAGGNNGREVINRFLSFLPQVLSDRGICYMVAIEENSPQEIIKTMAKMSFTTTIVVERKVWNERLKILKFQRNKV